MSYRFEIEHRTDGGARVTCGDHEARDERALARKMVNAGAPDGPIEAGRVGHVDYRVRSLHAFAATALYERETGLVVAPYSPHPEATVTPALAHAISSYRGRRKNGVSGAAGSPALECVDEASHGATAEAAE
jgi:hypothetical protein